VAFASRAGVRWLEMACQEPVNQPHRLDRARRTALRARLVAHDVGVVVHTASSVNAAEIVPGVRRAVSDYLVESVRLAVDLDSPTVVVHGGFHFGDHVATRLGSLADLLGTTAAYAAQHGVTLALENMNVLPPAAEIVYLGCTADEVVAILEAVRSPALTSCVDLGHAHLLPGGPAAFVARVGPRVGHVQITDNDGVTDDHLRLGDGTLDVGAALAALDSIGYTGTIAVELPDHDDQLASLGRLLEA